MVKIAKVAPKTFAAMSRISSLLVVVYKPCKTSIAIPKKTERVNAVINGAKILLLCEWLIKNKNQSDVKI
jgi:hypothetical protein